MHLYHFTNTAESVDAILQLYMIMAKKKINLSKMDNNMRLSLVPLQGR